jgi:hypothetical protein
MKHARCSITVTLNIQQRSLMNHVCANPKSTTFSEQSALNAMLDRIHSSSAFGSGAVKSKTGNILRKDREFLINPPFGHLVDPSLMASTSKHLDWWLSNEPSGLCDVAYASVAIKQSTLVRHAFEHPLSIFSIAWKPLPHQSHIIEFSVLKWTELNPSTLQIEGEVRNLAGLFSFTVDLNTGELLTVLAGHTVEQRFRKFYEAAVQLQAKLTRQEILGQYVEYAQDAAQYMVWGSAIEKKREK